MVLVEAVGKLISDMGRKQPVPPSQTDYPPEARPIVLGLLHKGSDVRSELHPCWIKPGPRLRQNCALGTKPLPHEIWLRGDASDGHKERCRDLQLFFNG